MAKTLLAIILLLCISRVTNAQQLTHSFLRVNPFKDMEFVKSYKDTATLNVVYTGEAGAVGENNMTNLKQIEKLHDINTSKFQNAIGFKLASVAGKFFIPYNSANQSVVASIRPDMPLKLKCTVFRFFTIDGVCNFFYIDKISR